MNRSRRVLSLAAVVLLVILSPASSAAAPVPKCDGRPATIVGTSGDDRLTGTNRDDVIVGLEGNDQITGGAGNDIICGSQGDDTLIGGAGAGLEPAGTIASDSSPASRGGPSPDRASAPNPSGSARPASVLFRKRHRA